MLIVLMGGDEVNYAVLPARYVVTAGLAAAGRRSSPCGGQAASSACSVRPSGSTS
ncbi:hypothetical protein D3C85_1834710 [compost metagenome]